MKKVETKQSEHVFCLPANRLHELDVDSVLDSYTEQNPNM